MKNRFNLRSLVAAALLGGAALQAGAALTVDSVITSGLFEPFAAAIGADGSYYITDSANHRVVKVPVGLTSLTLLAGQSGVAGTNNGVADAAQFNLPQGIVLARGGIVVADSANQLIRYIGYNGVVTNLAGAPGSYGLVNGQGSAARFRYPLGLAADAAGNIYIADSQNNSIRKLDTDNNVTTVASGFFQPAAVAVGDNGDLWVTDTRRHTIKRIGTNGLTTLIAGVPNVNGANDSTVGTNALFSNPRGLLWLGGATGLLISDSGNHSIRRLYYNTNFGTYSVSTFAGTPGAAGAVNGPALTSSFNSPTGLAFDQIGGGFLVVDKGNNLVRRINTGDVQPPVSDPTVGWVDLVKDDFGAFVTRLQPVVSGLFNNDVVIAALTEAGTQTYFTYGPTPANPFEDTIPEPGAGVGNTPPAYRDGLPPSSIPDTMLPPQPDVTIKAVGVADGRRSSGIVVSRFIFKAGNPSIVGDNAASFTVASITSGAELYYTWDGSEPTNNVAANPAVHGPLASGDLVSFNLENQDRTFKIRAFRANYRPSDTITKVFSPTNFAANAISFGFANGEGSSEFVAAPGQRFYAPVTLSVLPATKMYSLQFNVVVTNESNGALPVDGSTATFESALQYPVIAGGQHIGPDGQHYELIPPATVVGVDTNDQPVFANLMVTNPAINLLGVGWLERAGQSYLYPTLLQDLISYSQVHDTVFKSSDGRTLLGGYSFVVPPGSPDGSTYKIELGRASGTSDGVSKEIFVQIPTNGSLAAGPINGTKQVTVGSRRYLVGDSAPFRWFNAGDFGESNLLNNDVLQIFQSAVYQINLPPPGSDFFDSMDSSDGTVNDLYNGDINNILFGDGALNVDDIFVTFRRSLDPSLNWYVRYWQGGVRNVAQVPNGSSFTGPAAPSKKKSLANPTGTPAVSLSVDDVVGAPGATVQVPVRVRLAGGLPIRVAMLGLTVQPLDGAPALTSQITFAPHPGLGAPSMNNARSSNSVGFAWLNNTVAGITSDDVFGVLTVTIPAGASPTAAYRVHIDHFSASENGLALFRKHLHDGVLSTAPRTGSSWGDDISDAWRLRHFGSLITGRSTPNDDVDGDGANNAAEYRAGTNPQDAASVLRLNFRRTGAGVNLTFPTGLGRSYVLECAAELSGPWTAISTNAGTGLPREFPDTTGGKRFFRVRAQ